MSKRRASQHRPQRDTNTRDKREIEQENRQLKREVARLRKQLDKADEPVSEEEIKEEKASTKKCPKCRAALQSSITTPSGKIIHLCRGCMWKGSL